MLLLLYILWQVRKLTREFRSYKISNSNINHNELNEEDVKEIISEETSTPLKNLERGQFELFQKIASLTSKPPENSEKPPSPQFPTQRKVSFSEPNLKAKLFKKTERHDVISVNRMPIPNNPPIDLDTDSLPAAQAPAPVPAPAPAPPLIKRPKLVRSTNRTQPPAPVPTPPPSAPVVTQRRRVAPAPPRAATKVVTKPREKLPTASPSPPKPQLPSVQEEAVPQAVLVDIPPPAAPEPVIEQPLQTPAEIPSPRPTPEHESVVESSKEELSNQKTDVEAENKKIEIVQPSARVTRSRRKKK